MKILELSGYTSGIDGVWQRVREESLLLTREGNEVLVMSSNHIKGSDKIAPSEDNVGMVKIKRFSSKKLMGESFMYWDFKKAMIEGIKFHPRFIICHSYRHSHTKFALNLGRRVNAKVFLVTHAPFIKGDKTRTIPSKLAVMF